MGPQNYPYYPTVAQPIDDTGKVTFDDAALVILGIWYRRLLEQQGTGIQTTIINASFPEIRRLTGWKNFTDKREHYLNLALARYRLRVHRINTDEYIITII